MQGVLIPNTRYGTLAATPADTTFHPHTLVVCQPAGYLRNVVVALHGGGGTSASFANGLGVLTSGLTFTNDKVNWDMLQSLNTTIIFPQGQYCNGIDPAWGAGNNPWNPFDVASGGIPVWSNGAYWSGYDDKQFANDLAKWIIARYGTNTQRILAGLSLGAIMANRMTYESEGNYTVICSVSGSPSGYFALHPDIASTPVPVLSQFGELDGNIGLDGHLTDPLIYMTTPSVQWAQNPPVLIGMLQGMQIKVTAYNASHGLAPETVLFGDGVTTAVLTGSVTTWTYSGGANVLKLYSDADHTGIQTVTGRSSVADWVQFARTVS